MASPFSGKAGRQAGMYMADKLENANVQNQGYLDSAMGEARGLYGNAQERFTPLSSLTGSGSEMYGNALGLNGAQGNQAAVGAFQAGPGYQFAQDASQQAGLRAANAGGMLNSGNAMIALSDRSRGMADQEYGGWLDRLSGLSTLGANVAGQQAGLDTGLAGLGTQVAGAKAGLNATAAQGIGQAGAGALRAGQDAAANRMNFGINALSGLTSLGAGMFGGPQGAGMFAKGGAFGG